MKNIFSIIVFVALTNTFFAQSVINLDDNSLSYEEKMELGKAYIDETFPSCDIDYFAPHSIFITSSTNDIELPQSKDSWVTNYKYEYDLYMYYHQKLYDINNRKEKSETTNLEKVDIKN